MPNLDFSLLVEITTNINDFSFMELHNVMVKRVGTNIKTAASQIVQPPTASYDSSEEVPFNDRAVLDFGNLTVSKKYFLLDKHLLPQGQWMLLNNPLNFVTSIIQQYSRNLRRTIAKITYIAGEFHVWNFVSNTNYI